MTLLASPVGFPQVDPTPVSRLAADICRVSEGLADAGQSVESVRRSSESQWTGIAADAFRQRMADRTHRIRRAAHTIHRASPALEQFAHAMRATSEAHRNATVRYAAATAMGAPGVIHQYAASHDQRAAVSALDAAGQRLAEQLERVRSELTRCHVDETSTDARTDEASVLDQWIARSGTALGVVQYWGSAVADGVGGYAEGLRQAVRRYAIPIRSRPFTRWRPNVGGPSTGLTAAQAASRSAAIARWTARRIPILNGAISGVSQGLQDQDDPQLDRGDRIRRVAAATTVEGVTAWGSAAVGAKGGAVLGAMLGGPPGAIVGGVVGGIGGAIVGSEVGRRAKEWLFSWNPRGWFG